MRSIVRFVGALCLLATVSVVLVLLRLLTAGRMRRLAVRTTVRHTSRALCATVGVAQDVRGPRPRGSALVVANHLSWLDIVCALSSWPCTFVAKREVRSWPLIGAIADALGVVFVDRIRKRDVLRAIPALENALRSGECVVLFAEGTTTLGTDVAPFRSALFEAAVRAGTPIVPLSVGGRGADSRGPTCCWVGDEPLLRNLFRVCTTRGAMHSLRVGAAIDAGSDRKRLARMARDHVVRRFVPVVVDEVPRVAAQAVPSVASGVLQPAIGSRSGR